MVEVDFKKQKIGEILVGKKLITESQLDESLGIQEETGEKLGEILIRKGFINDEILVELISFQRGFDIRCRRGTWGFHRPFSRPQISRLGRISLPGSGYCL